MGPETQNLPIPLFLAAIAIRTAIIYFVMVAGILLTGKRQIGNLNLFDIAMVLLLGNAIQNAITTGSGEIGAGLVSAGVLLVSNRLIRLWFTNKPEAQKMMIGEPVILVYDGVLDEEMCKKEGIDKDLIQAAARDIGVTELAKVRLAILENDGSISVVPMKDEKTR